MVGAVKTSVRRLAENFWPTSRSRRTTTGIIHVPVEIFQNEDGLDGHGLHVGERLHGIGGVVDGGLRNCGVPAASPRLPIACGAATPPPERTRPSAIVHSKIAKFRSEQARRTSETARSSSTVSITTIGRGGVDQNLQPVEWLWIRPSERIHMYLTRRDLLPYNISSVPTGISLLAQSRTNKGNKPHGKSFFGAEARPSDNEANRPQPGQHIATAHRSARACARAWKRATKPPPARPTGETVSALDKAIQKGVLHENTASRYKSRLSARLNA